MSNELSTTSNKLFEELKETFNGVECWDARKLMPHVGYVLWQNFHNAIEKAMEACRTNGEPVENQFLLTPIKTSAKGGRPAVNYKLTRRACYFVFQNGDPKIAGIAAAQAYFVRQTIRQEQEAQRRADWKRVGGRRELSMAEDAMTKVVLSHDVKPPQLATIRSNGDAAFFGKKTSVMKEKWGVPEKQPLSDFLAIVLLNAKATAAGLTAHNTVSKSLFGYKPINEEHAKNSKDMREMLGKNGIKPEDAAPEIDINQVYIRLGISKGPRKPMAEGQQSLLDFDQDTPETT